MIPTRIISILFLITTLHPCIGQDTTVFVQQDAFLFSSSYTFVRQNKGDHFGTFLQSCASDVLDTWTGKGVFIEKRNKICLTFDTTLHHNRVINITGEKNSDTLYIQWFDWWGEEQVWYNVRYADTTTFKTIYHPSWTNGVVKIPKSELQDNRLTIGFANSSEKIIVFDVDSAATEVHVFANYSPFMHAFDKEKEVLKKKKNGFIAKGMFNGNKKTLFVPRQKG